MNIAFQVVKDFEQTVADYTGAKHAVAVDSCTNALFLCCKYLNVDTVTIPKHTYVSVPCSIIHAGGQVKFEDKDWGGIYQLEPYPIYDCALRFTSGMYIPNTFCCLSFHAKKVLQIGRGGMILTDNDEAAKWFRKARYNGRDEIPLDEDDIEIIGWNFYMSPELASRGLHLMACNITNDMPDKIQTYPDLSKMKAFQ